MFQNMIWMILGSSICQEVPTNPLASWKVLGRHPADLAAQVLRMATSGSMPWTLSQAWPGMAKIA